MEDDREEFVEKETEKEKEVVRPTTEAEEGEESGDENVAERQETEIDPSAPRLIISQTRGGPRIDLPYP